MKKLNNVNKYRVKKNITLTELAYRVDTSYTMLNRIENYLSEPRVTLALRLAKELNATVEELFKDVQ